MKLIEFKELKGKIIKKIEKVENGDGGDAIKFTTDLHDIYLLTHLQDCCEDVYLESITGDINNVLNNPIISADVIEGECKWDDKGDIHSTFVFYEIKTVKGLITIRFNGSSNGNYSEKAELYKI